ncbi:hypothetical protein B0H13DRAFT_1585975, partial [Mycena leptocephala]
YVVFYGREVAVFQCWPDAQRSITGAGLAIHAGYPSMEAGLATLNYARSMGWTADSTSAHGATHPTPSIEPNPLNASSKSNVWYVVCRGVVPGVYRSFLECSLNTSGVKGNMCNRFTTLKDAESAFDEALKSGWVRSIPRV